MSKWPERLALALAVALALMTFSGAGDGAAWAAIAAAVAAGVTGFARQELAFRELCRLDREQAARLSEQPDPDAPEVTHGGYAPSNVRHPVVAELDALFTELTRLDEVRVAVGSVTGTAPSEIWEFAVLAVDHRGGLAAVSNVEKYKLDALLHRAHQELIGGKSSERSDDSGS